ncbi:sulfatase [Pirellulales bacterium]|nr:sulfatase [Pirellulales bacterium]
MTSICRIVSVAKAACVVRLLLCALVFAGIFQPHAVAESGRPNFVVILTDDQGWTGSSVSMSASRGDARSDYYWTPNLERLARQGMRFSQGYAPAAICSPTRRSIQFGQTPARQGEVGFAKAYPTTTSRLTIPRVLKSVDANYRAAHFGKWDLRTDLSPEHLGYDQSDGNTGNRDGNVASRFGKIDKWRKHMVTDDPKSIFGITDRATQFMEQQVRGGHPFFLQISHYAVHADTQTTHASLDKFDARPQGHIHRRAPFAGMTYDLDAGIGSVLDKIEELGIAKSTYVIFLADNGAVPCIPPNKARHLGHPSLHPDFSNNHPLRGGKWTLFEGGICVPWIVAGPNIAPHSWCDVPVVGWDLLPTIADLASYQQPLPKDLDGGSFRTLLECQGQGEVRRSSPGLVFHRYSRSNPHSAIRVGDFKLIKFWQGVQFLVDIDGEGNGRFAPLLLYNLKNDLSETHNLAEQMPGKTQELADLLDGYLENIQAEALP